MSQITGLTDDDITTTAGTMSDNGDTGRDPGAEDTVAIPGGPVGTALCRDAPRSRSAGGHAGSAD